MPDLTRLRRDIAPDNLEERRFTCAVSPNHGHTFPRFNSKTSLVEQGEMAVGHRNTVERDERHAKCIVPSGRQRPRAGAVLISNDHMPQTVEISLRIPSLRIRRDDSDALETINNSDIRFSKQIELESIPKPGVVLKMAISSGETFDCDVVRSDWHHTKNMFVIACRYSKRSVSPAEYRALMNSSDWQVRALM
jgi:hypothetical protein